MAADGELIIDASVNKAGLFKGFRDILKAISSWRTSSNRLGQDMAKSGNKYAQSVQRAATATQTLDRKIKDLSDRWREVNREMTAIQKAGGDGKRYNALSQEARKLSNTIQELRAQKAELNSVSQGFDTVTDNANAAAQAVAHMGGHSRNMASSLARMISGGVLGFLKKLASGAKNAAIQLAKLTGRAVTKGLQSIGRLASRAGKALFGLGNKAKQSGHGFNLSLKTILKYGLGIRSLFVLFNRLRNAVKQGFDSLMKSDTRVKAALESLSRAMNGLKGSFASAFSPILTAIAPALTTLINLLATATSYVAMFFAALTGQSYYMAAKGISTVGKAASGAAGSAKELKRQLAGFDELEILSDKNDGSGGGGGGAGSEVASYTKIPIDSGIAAFVNRLKELFANGEYEAVGAAIADGINGAFERVQSMIRWEKIAPVVTKYVQPLEGLLGTVSTDS